MKALGFLFWIIAEIAWKAADFLRLAAARAHKLQYKLGCVAWHLGYRAFKP